MRKIVLTLVTLFAVSSLGCQTIQRGAVQVGGAEDSTWVFVQTDNTAVTGIFRCHDEGGRPICVKAKVGR